VDVSDKRKAGTKARPAPHADSAVDAAASADAHARGASGYGLALAITLAYAVFLGWFAFLDFKIGTYQTETDFYWSYWPKAEAISHGELVWGDFRPPFYPLVLAGAHVFVSDYYRAGMLLSLFSAVAAGLFCFGIFRRIWGAGFALAALALLLVHPEFSRHAYCPGTDMFFVALCAAAVWAGMSQRNLTVGLLIGLAFMTRYNGIFLLPAALWFSRERWRLLGGFSLVTGVFAVLSYQITGAIFPNRNYLNVAFMLFGEHTMTWDQFWYTTRETQYTSLGQVLLLDPGHTVRSIGQNVGVHLWQDAKHLALYPVAGLALFGLYRERRTAGLRPLLANGALRDLVVGLVF
jgi:4-amino-4-deoxy-L-arabinose transferase-like glycosyltransferase